MTGETERSPSGWTIDTLKVLSDEREHHAEERLTWMDRWLAERDRRYTEVKNAEEKALRIKEDADKTALGLQRENQQYRDEKGNELRAQIERERGTYITRTEFKPVGDYVGAQTGPRALTPAAVATVIAALAAVATFFYYSTHRPATSGSTPAIVCTATYHPSPCP